MVDLVEQLREVKDREFSPESLRVMVLWGADEVERLRGTLRYIATQAKAAHPGALAVIQANAESVLDRNARRLQDAITERELR